MRRRLDALPLVGGPDRGLLSERVRLRHGELLPGDGERDGERGQGAAGERCGEGGGGVGVGDGDDGWPRELYLGNGVGVGSGSFSAAYHSSHVHMHCSRCVFLHEM